MLGTGLDAASGLGAHISGRLRINAPRPSLQLLVNRLLPDFLELHPRIQLDLVGDDRLIDIVEEGFDAGVRLGQMVQMDMVSVWLTPPERFVVVGTPAFFARHGRPLHPRDLQNFRCILLQQSAQMLDQWQFAIDGHYLEQKDLETVLDQNSVEVPGLSLYYPSGSKPPPKLRAFVDFAVKRMRRAFQASDYLPDPAV